jgi:hypothetical protein
MLTDDLDLSTARAVVAKDATMVVAMRMRVVGDILALPREH